MNKENKFRAWDNVEMKMYYTGEEDSIHFYFDSYGIVAERFVDVEISTLEGDKFISSESEKLEHLVYMQYTGLKDKNDVEICEGDVVKCSDFMSIFNSVVKLGEYEQDGSAGEYTPVKCMGFYVEVIEKGLQSEWGIDLVLDYKETSSLQSFEQVEVIGNIYDNPELLEVQP